MTYFSRDEFKCGCGCGQNNINELLIDKLENIRTVLRQKIIITSGYRCEKHNLEIGGVPDSSHLKGLAADIKIQSDKYLFEILPFTLVEFNRIGIYKTWIHVDIDSDKTGGIIWRG